VTIIDTSTPVNVFNLVPVNSPLESYLRWSTEAHGSPPIYHLMGILAAAAHELAKRGFHIEGGWPLNLWVCMVGESSSGKSTVLSMVKRFAADLRATTTSPEVVDWIQAEGSIAGLLTAISEHFDKGRGTTTCTLYHNEFASLFATREPVSEMLCQLVDGDDYQRNLRELQRKSAKNVNDRIVAPVISGLFCTTEEQLAEHFKAAHRTGGLFSRVTWVKGSVLRENLRLPAAHPRGILPLEYWAVQDVWKAWLVVLEFAGAEQGRALKFSPESLEILKTATFLPLVEKWKSNSLWVATRLRYVDRTRVLASVFAAARGSLVVWPEDIQRAIRLVDVLLEHATSLTSIGADPTTRLAGRAERFVLSQGNEGATRSELYTALRTNKRDLDAALETLVDQECVIEDRKSGDGRLRLFHVGSEYAKKARTRSMS
jgi:hypothetical protein